MQTQNTSTTRQRVVVATGLIFQPFWLTKQLLVIRDTSAVSTHMRRIADEFFVGLEIRLQQLLEFTKGLGHGLHPDCFYFWPAGRRG